MSSSDEEKEKEKKKKKKKGIASQSKKPFGFDEVFPLRTLNQPISSGFLHKERVGEVSGFDGTHERVGEQSAFGAGVTDERIGESCCGVERHSATNLENTVLLKKTVD
jgi:hypothetical protein